MPFVYLCVRTGFAKSSEVYKSLGHFDYDMLFHTAYRIWEYIEAWNDKIVDVYTGEITREITGKTCICNGAGIKVHSNGDIEEGYWINGLPLMSKKPPNDCHFAKLGEED